MEPGNTVGEREGEMDLEEFVREEEEVAGTETHRPCLSSYVDEGSKESHRYYLARRTVMEMLKDRRFAVPIEQIQLTLQEFRAIYGQIPNLDLLNVSFSHISNPSKKIKVIFSGPGVVKVHMIRNLAGQLGDHNSYCGMILIIENRITNPALKALDLFSFKVEIFQVVCCCGSVLLIFFDDVHVVD
ncbi:Eukaryotic rpb5 RNA polymerase subunit family protein isoform 1 [Tripterygium wilfordii]|uniref:Eukaryotic rpb5 RNA polymerase subunit family protein isoform 1 n=1 Tax=Tripterygium wilfordii TaxID=458696 RepID=A0A7J7DNS3_TRIWF|nr:Eukaryotic rpb5 RNA polymerase subunit family protein isoform 1 [Tripterygium wilfordii]